MWDVLIAVGLMAFGAIALIVVCSVIAWAVFFLQNGGRDE